MALRAANNNLPWNEWTVTEPDPELYKAWRFAEYAFFSQWAQIKKYANSKNISIIGDIPIYVSWDSADVWSSPESFQLDERCNPKSVAGVPPDYFSEDGQLWGNPLYDWKKMKEFAELYYPDTEIISVNPVGLKGLFKDEFTETYIENKLELFEGIRKYKI